MHFVLENGHNIISSLSGLYLVSEIPKKSVSVPEELVVYGHSRTPSYASQQSKISGTKHRDTSLFHSQKDKIIITQSAQIIYISSHIVFSFCFFSRLQLKSLQFNRSEPSEECVRRFCLHRHRQHPRIQRSAGRERREGEQVHSTGFCKLSPCT